MLAIDTDPSALAGLELVDRRGERIGRIRQLYPEGARLGWAGVRGNLFGTEEALVPLDGAVLDDDVVGLPITRSRFQSAPRRRPDAALDDAERARLRRFWSEPAPLPLEPAPSDGPDEQGAAEEITAYQERLHVETERVPRTRVRLRKVVVTEERTVTVPVRREEYRLIREPVEAGDAIQGGSIGESDQEVVLYEERVVVSTEVVAVERVRLVKEEVVEQRTVSGTVRGERIEFEEEGTAVVPAPLEADVVEPPATTDAPDAEEAEEVAPVRALQPAATARSTKRPTGSRSPRSAGSTPARSSTAAASAVPPSADDSA